MIGCSPGFLARAVEAAEGVPLTALPDRLGRVALRSGDERNKFGSVTFVIVFFKNGPSPASFSLVSSFQCSR